MPFQKGHKLATGRKTLEEELAMYREKIKQITLEELAASKIYSHMENHTEENDRQGVKDIALPIYLKSKVDKQEVNLIGKPILYGVFGNNSDKENNTDKEENTDNTGGNISEQDSVDSIISDTPSSN